MASFEVTGTLKMKFDTQVVSEKFSKRDFVLTTDTSTQYPQQVTFQLIQDRCAQLDNFQQGEEIKVSFNLRGREWTSPQNETKYFNTLEAWRIEKAQTHVAAPQPAQNYQNPAASTPADVLPTSNVVDDLPF